MFWLALIVLAGVAGVYATRRSRLLGGGPPQKLLTAGHDGLREFADEHGWKFFAGDDKQVRGEAWKLFAMAGPPSLEVAYALKAMNPIQLMNAPEARYREKWDPTRDLVALLRRDTADGPQTVLGATARGGTKVVIACITTQATVDHFGLDIVGWDSKVYASGEAPEGIEFNEVLSGLSAPLRLHFAEGTLLLRVPGTLTPKMMNTLVERLDMVRNALPMRPDLVGPLR